MKVKYLFLMIKIFRNYIDNIIHKNPLPLHLGPQPAVAYAARA